MVNFSNIIFAPYKLAGAAPKAVFNCCTGKTDLSDLNPCHRDDSNTTTSSSSQQEASGNPLGGIFGGGGGAGKNTKFLDYSFNDLPSKARNAAMTLGFAESNWGGWAECEEKWWEDLSATEIEAATTLGWDQSAWDNHYEDKNWEDLLSHVQTAAGNLGFMLQMWNDDE